MPQKGRGFRYKVSHFLHCSFVSTSITMMSRYLWTWVYIIYIYKIYFYFFNYTKNVQYDNIRVTVLAPSQLHWCILVQSIRELVPFFFFFCLFQDLRMVREVPPSFMCTVIWCPSNTHPHTPLAHSPCMVWVFDGSHPPDRWLSPICPEQLCTQHTPASWVVNTPEGNGCRIWKRFNIVQGQKIKNISR